MSITHFNPTLTSTQYNKLRSTHYEGERLVSLFSNRVVFAAQVNSDLTTPTNWAQFNFTAVTVGAWTDIIPGQALYIGTVNDITQATFLGRIRKEPTSSIIYSNESSQNFDVGDFCWVVDRYDITYVYSRPSASDPQTAVELVNYDEVYQAMRPSVRGLQTGYAGYVNPSTGKLRLGFDVSQALAAQSGATIASTNFSFTGATLVAGSLSGSIVIVDLVYGEQWAACAVVDSGGRGTTRRFGIKVHDPDLYPPDTGFKGGSISTSLDQGYTLSLPAFADVDDVLPNTFGIVWRNDEMYGSTDGDLYGNGASAAITNKQLTTSLATLTSVGHPFVPGQVIIIADVGTPFNGTFEIISTTVNTFSYTVSADNVASTPCGGMGVVNPRNVDFVGWLMSEEDPVKADRKHSVISGANFSFTGVGPRLARLVAQLLAIRQSASPTLWGEITNLTPWRAIWHFLSRYTTIATLCDVWFEDTTDTYLFPDFGTEGNALSVIQTFAQQIDCNIEFAPWGAIGVNKDVNFDHAGTVVNQWTSSDFLEFSRSYDPNPSEGLVDSDGAFYNSLSAQVTDYTARAPGIAQGEAEGRGSYPARVLAATTSTAQAKAELLQRTGDKFVFDNLKEFFNCTWRAPWVGAQMMPSRSQVSTLTLDDTLANANNVNRLIYDQVTQWTIENVTTDFDEKKGFMVNRGRIRRVTVAGDPADDTTVVLPAPGEIPEALPFPGLPAFNFDLPELTLPNIGLELSDISPSLLLPPVGKIAQFNGSELIVWSADAAEYLKNVIALRSPMATDITPPDLGSYQIKQIVVSPFFTASAIPAKILASDTTNSAVWNIPNAAAPGASSLAAQGEIFPGEFKVIRATNVDGTDMVYSPGVTGTPVLVDTFSIDSSLNVVQSGSYITNALKTYLMVISGTFQFSPNPTDLADAVYSTSDGWVTHSAPSTLIELEDTTFFVADDNTYTATHSYSMTRAGTGTTFGGKVTDPLVIDNVGSFTVTVYEISTTGRATVRVMTDNGGTAGVAIDAGVTTGSIGGFDVQRAGTVSYAAAAAKVRKATTIGGAYADWYSIPGSANAICIIIPYFRRNSTTRNTSISDPDVVIGCDNGKLYWIDGTAVTATDITPPGSTAFEKENAITIQYGHHLAVFCLVSGTRHLFTSTDGGSSWTDRGMVTSPGFIRTRRNDTRGSASGADRGQLFMVQGSPAVVDYSSVWASGSGTDAGMWPRILPVSNITGLETVW